jgi:hypothetical protein
VISEKDGAKSAATGRLLHARPPAKPQGGSPTNLIFVAVPRVVKPGPEDRPNFAKNKKGHIALQGDHGNVCYANIKLLPLPAKKSK